MLHGQSICDNTVEAPVKPIKMELLPKFIIKKQKSQKSDNNNFYLVKIKDSRLLNAVNIRTWFQN